MQKWIVLLILLTLFVPARADKPSQQTYEAPYELLPSDTWLYFEFPGQNFPVDMPLAPWVGERIGVGIYSAPGAFPAVAVIFQVRDEAAADEFVRTIAGQGWVGLATPGYRILTDTNSGRKILQTPGYLVMGSGIDSIGNVLDSRQTNLGTDTEFNRVRDFISEDSTFWMYTPLGGMAIEASEDVFTIETVFFGLPLLTGVPDALEESMFEGVPQDAFVVAAGTDIALYMQQFNLFSEAILQLTGSEQTDLLNDLFRTATGVDYEREFLPLFDGGYAAFATSGYGAIYDAPEIPIDGGFILSPEDTANAAFTGNKLTNRLEQSGVTVNRLSATQFSLDIGEMPDIYYGFSNGQLYLSTENGAEAIQNAFDGRNLTDNSTWHSAFEHALEGTQQVLYVNLQLAAGFINAGVTVIPAEFQNFALTLIETLRKFESLTLFSRLDEDGTYITKLVLQ